MPFEFKFPDVGEGITEGEIVKFLVKEGDQVKEDQTIAQIETDKAVVDIPSPKSGIILKLNFKEGDKIQVGQVLATIGEKGEKVYTSPSSLFPPKKTTEVRKTLEEKPNIIPKKGQSVVGQLEEAPEEEVEVKPQSLIMRGQTQSRKVQTTPAIREIAREKGIDLTKISGSGEDGRILKSDLDENNQIPQQQIVVKKKYDDYGYLDRVPLKGIRKSIADNMGLSVKIPQATMMEDIFVDEIIRIKNKESQSLQKQKIKLTLLPFIIKATIASLSEVPILNSTLEDNEILIRKYFNIGVAVETEVGLMVPVVKIAQNKTIPQIAKEIQELAEKCRTRKIDIMDLQGGTFTITNYGSIGGTYGTPLLNSGEAGILGIGRIHDKVVQVKDKFKSVKIMPVSLTFDHRITDGAQASRFLEKLKTYIEDPEHLLLEMK